MRKVLISKDLLQDLYVNRGLTTYQVAEKLGFCQGTIWNRLSEYGIKPRLSYVPVNFSKKQLKNWYIDQKLSTWEIEKRFGYPRGTIYRKLNEFGLHTRNIAVSHIRFPRKDFSGNILERAYLIGFRIGDLNVSKGGLQSETIAIKCASTKQGQVELFKNLFAKYGHIIQGKPTKESKINIQANLNLSFSFLLDKSPDSYKWVFKNKKTFFAFLAGFSDAEGSFYISRGRGLFAIGNYDVGLLRKIKIVLERFGIETLPLTVDLRKGKIVSGFISRGDYYTLRCGRKVYLLKLLSHLVPYLKHGDKLAKADLVKKNILERNVRFGFV
ncbi:MAG: LAGLIDADG family homing endonuclease [Patescibacteria group bacterium]